MTPKRPPRTLPGPSGLDAKIGQLWPRIRPGAQRLPFVVTPGNAEARRGGNLVVLVETASRGRPVAIAWRKGEGEWENASMETASGSG